MLFAERSIHLIKMILPYFNSVNTYQNEVMSFRTDLEKWFLLLYNNYMTAVTEVSNASKKSYNPTLKNISDGKYKKPDAFDYSSYIPIHIKQYINDKKRHQVVFSAQINGRSIELIFTVFKDIRKRDLRVMQIQTKRIYSLIYFLSNLSERKCSKSLTIYLYMTKFKKEMPVSSTELLSPDNVNTGLTRRCATDNEVVIYREEEWFKVLIHELIHSFGLDFHSSNDMRGELNAIFNVKSEYIFEEAYVETWARILNCAICCFHAKDMTGFDDFLLSLNFTLQLERIYSLYQCDKILRSMNLRFKNILKKTSNSSHFREETNVFCYYVISGILMNNYGDFINWCATNNTGIDNSGMKNIIQFGPARSNQANFIAFINAAANSLAKKDIVREADIFKYTDDGTENTLTMTMIETPIK